MSADGPIGYFVHHQGRGHAERALALADAFARRHPVTLFCARPDMLGDVPHGVRIIAIPSLFEAPLGTPQGFDQIETPDTLHCAPLGWASIREAVATITGWFAEADPALFVTDVSAELAQLARIASVPHVAVLQHGRRDDPGHVAAYRGALALLAPYHRRLEQDDRPEWMRARTIHAAGVGIAPADFPTRREARAALGIDAATDVVVALGGGGGEGLPSAALSLGARGEPSARWFTLGAVETPWHQTQPANLTHLGWRSDVPLWLAAADRIVSTCGNTTVHEVAALNAPWIAIPQWRYFDEQRCKAEVLAREGIASVAPDWPARVQDWASLWERARAFDPAARRGLVDPDAAETAVAEIELVLARGWGSAPLAPSIGAEAAA